MLRETRPQNNDGLPTGVGGLKSMFMAGAFRNIASVAWDTNTGEVTVLGTDGQRLEARIAPRPSDPTVRAEADFQAEELVLVFDGQTE